MHNHTDSGYEQRVLRALRQVIRSVDRYSRKLFNEFGLTTPQLVCLYALEKSERMTLTELSRTVDLGISTVNGIIDRLEAKGCVKRSKSLEDRRKVYLQLTRDGKAIVSEAPSLLQDRLSESFARLSESEQMAITTSLERIVKLMEAEHIEASPNLFPGDQSASPAPAKPETPEKDLFC